MSLCTSFSLSCHEQSTPTTLASVSLKTVDTLTRPGVSSPRFNIVTGLHTRRRTCTAASPVPLTPSMRSPCSGSGTASWLAPGLPSCFRAVPPSVRTPAPGRSVHPPRPETTRPGRQRDDQRRFRATARGVTSERRRQAKPSRVARRGGRGRGRRRSGEVIRCAEDVCGPRPGRPNLASRRT